MDEEVSIIDTNTRNEKIKNFFINNKKNLIIGFFVILVFVIGYLSITEMKVQNKIKLANQFNLTTINFKTENKEKTIDQLTKLINENDPTYSPLALYFIIDNNIVTTQKEINELFDEILKIRKLDKEIKNLIIYKKGLLNSDFKNENDLIKILSPVLNSNSIWKSHALFLMGEYFLGKNEKQKAKEFLEKILILENSNPNIKLETQRLIQRELGE